MVNRIVINSGNNRRVFDVSNMDREKVSEDLKNLVCRGGKLPFVALNGA